MWEAEAKAEIQWVNSLKKKQKTKNPTTLRPVVHSDSSKALRLIVLLGRRVLCGALRMDCSTF